MSGQYSGLHAQIKAKNPKALFVPCSAHSLNLVGTCAASFCSEECTFFNLIQNVYKFFVASTKRWETLLSFQSKINNKPLKSLSETRSAIEKTCKDLESVILALEHYEDDVGEKTLVRSEATGLLRTLNRLETMLMMEPWSDILERFEKVSQTLHKVDTSLEREL